MRCGVPLMPANSCHLGTRCPLIYKGMTYQRTGDFYQRVLGSSPRRLTTINLNVEKGFTQYWLKAPVL